MVIINADDLGMNQTCSRAIATAFSMGLVTDTTMMANGAYFDGALRLSKEQGFIDKIGIHLNLTEGIPLTKGIRRSDKFVKNGRFHKGYDWKEPLTETEEQAVCEELTAQVLRLKSAGIAITHADSHHYIHNAPFIAPIVLRVCRAQGIGKIRLQRNLGTEDPAINALYREQGFRTTKYFGRLRDAEETVIPDGAELLAHPDLDRDGRLIDRRGIEDGFPVGDLLIDLRKRSGIVLGNYKLL